ncbi:MAG TPA: hypothetical protein VMT05_07025 [Terriglobales bacterium]|nr:hypothetical protein [Terriglobales bacterium]
MPLLVVVAAVIAFVLIISLLLLADLAERKHGRQLRLGPLSQPFSALSVVHAFDPERFMLWDTQLPLLEQLHSAGSRGCPLPQFCCFYQQLARRFPELYEGSSFEHWLGFLAAAELVRLDPDRGYITAHGHQFVQEFLKCRVAAGGPGAGIAIGQPTGPAHRESFPMRELGSK